MKLTTIAIALTAVACVSAHAIPNYAAYESDNMDLMKRSLTKRDEAQDKTAIGLCIKGAIDILLTPSPPLPEDDPTNAKVCTETAGNLKAKIIEKYNSIAGTDAPSGGERPDLVASLQEKELTLGDLEKLNEALKSVQGCIKANDGVANGPTGIQVLPVVDDLVEATNMALSNVCLVSESP